MVEILIQICAALIAAHASGVIHRDLKLDNVFVLPGEDGGGERVKVLDWGIAKDVASDIHSTIAGQLVGTPPVHVHVDGDGAVTTSTGDTCDATIKNAIDCTFTAPAGIASRSRTQQGSSSGGSVSRARRSR